MSSDDTPRPSIVYFGMTGEFSRSPLEALLVAGLPVRAVVLPALAGQTAVGVVDAPPVVTRLPLATPPAGMRWRPLLPQLAPPSLRSIMHVAAERAIPVLEVAQLADARTLARLADFAPDVICVACFPWRFPRALLALPRLGCLNVHPSLLPDNRGPDPLFWTFRRGDEETGVTIHRMDERLDAGPILAQRAIPVPEGIAEAALERACAAAGGELLARAVLGLAAGATRPAPQDETRATSYPLPGPDDYSITPERPACWAWTFARGLAGRGRPIHISVAGATFRLIEPLEYAADAEQREPWRLDGRELWLRCTPGIFHARVARVARQASAGTGR